MKKILAMAAAVVVPVFPVRGTEVAPSRTLEKNGNFEIREYPALVLAETTQASGESNSSFGRLFRYISGANDAERKIPMTAPVFMDGHSASGRMAFVMPADLPFSETPAARDQQVKIRSERPGTFAVLRFGGFANPANEARALEKLRQILAERNLEADGEPFFAYYDPPWTIPPFRRNEVLVRLRP